MINPIAIAILMFGQTAAKPVEYNGPRKRAAVSGFELLIDEFTLTGTTPSGLPTETSMSIDQPGEIGEGMSEMLVTALIGSKRFVVLERKNMKDIEDELNLQKSTAVNPDSVVEAGKLLGAQVLLRGALTELSYKKNTTGLGTGALGDLLDGVIGGKAEFIATVGIDLKVIDVATGQILDSVHTEGRIGNKTQYFGIAGQGIAFGHASFDSTPIAKAMRAAIENGVKKLTTRFDKIPWEARVASVSEATDPQLIYLNFGETAGIKVGTELELFRPGKAIVDPQTKEVLGREDDKPLGKCKVRTVNERFAVAIVTDGTGIQAGDGVRIPVALALSSSTLRGDTIHFAFPR